MTTKLQRSPPKGGKKRNQNPKQQQLAVADEDLDGNGKRLEKSLATMTVNVVDLLKHAPKGILNLGEATKKLQIIQKRRIYDVTNVLEGIGLIEKFGKNSVKWRGDSVVPDARETSRAIRLLRHDRTSLLQYEDQLDQHLKQIQQSITNSKLDESNSSFGYVTSDDLVDIFGAQSTNIAITKHPKQIQPTMVMEKGARTLNISSVGKQPLDVRLLREPHGACFSRPIRKVNIDRRRRTQSKLDGASGRDKASAMPNSQQMDVGLSKLTDQVPANEQNNPELNLNSELFLEQDLTRCSQFQPNQWAGPDLDPDSPFVPLDNSNCLSYLVSLDPSEGTFDLFDLESPSLRDSQSATCYSQTDNSVAGSSLQLDKI